MKQSRDLMRYIKAHFERDALAPFLASSVTDEVRLTNGRVIRCQGLLIVSSAGNMSANETLKTRHFYFAQTRHLHFGATFFGSDIYLLCQLGANAAYPLPIEAL